MVEYLINVLPVVLPLLACAVNSTAPDVSEDQFGCKSIEHCYPFIALLVDVDVMCSAAILSTSWMVSSAYCYEKSGRRAFLAYAGSSNLTAAENLQVRCAEVTVWADPVSGAMTQEASEWSQLMLLQTSAPWTVTMAVQPVAIGEHSLSPSALQESNCIIAGFDLNKILAVTSCDADVHWKEDGQVCFNRYSSGAVPVAPGLLLYCRGSDILVGVGLGGSDLPSNNMDDSQSVLESCFTYLGGTLLNSLQHIADNNSVTDLVMKAKTSRLHINEANHVVTFIAASRTANRVHTISNSSDAAVNENHEDVGKHSSLEERDFTRNDDLDQTEMVVTFIAASRTANRVHTISNSSDAAVNENHEAVGKHSSLEERDFTRNDDLDQTEMVLDYKKHFTATPVDAIWALVLVPVVLCYMVVRYWTTGRKLVRRLSRSAQRKNASHNYECT